MNKKTYADLSNEDKLLMDGLFMLKSQAEFERRIIRDIIKMLRDREMECTKDMMNLSQRAIGEKFELGPNSAKQLTKKAREDLLNKKSEEDIKRNKVDTNPFTRQKLIMKKIHEKKTRSENGHESGGYSQNIAQDSRGHG